MSKFKTTVLIFGFILMGFSDSAFAQTTTVTGDERLQNAEKKLGALYTCAKKHSWDISSKQSTLEATFTSTAPGGKASELEQRIRQSGAPTKVDSCVNDIMGGSNSDGDDSLPGSCSSSITDLGKANRDLSKACSKAGMTSSNINKCVQQSDNCTECQGFESSQMNAAQSRVDLARKNYKSSEDSDQLKNELAEARDALSSSEGDYASFCGDFATETTSFFDKLVSGQSLNQVNDLESSYSKQQGRIMNCPTLAGEGLDDFRDEVEDYKDKRDDLLERVNDLREKKNELETQISNLETEYQNQASEDQEEYEKAQKELTEQIIEGLPQELQQLMQEVQTARDEVNDKIREKDLEIEQTKLAAKNEIRQISIACGEDAEKKMAEIRERELQRIQAKNFKVSSAGKLFGRAGITNDDRSNARMDYYTSKCMRKKSTKQREQAVKETAFAAIQTLREQKNIYERQLQRLAESEQEAVKALDKKKLKLYEQRADAEKQFKASQERKFKNFTNSLNELNRQLYGEQPVQSKNGVAAYMQLLKRSLDPNNPQSSTVAASAGVLGQLAYAENRLENEERYLNAKETFLAFREKASPNLERGSGAEVGGEIIGAISALESATSSCECCFYKDQGYSPSKVRKIEAQCEIIAKANADLGESFPSSCDYESSSSSSSSSSSDSRSAK